MNDPKHSTTDADSSCCAELECRPCDFDQFCRNAYFTGKLLTERDFTAEQRYFIDKARLHQQALHGWGIVCGLTMAKHEHCPHLRIVIESGLAVDTCGRDIYLPERIEWQLPQIETPPARKDECPPDNAEKSGPNAVQPYRAQLPQPFRRPREVEQHKQDHDDDKQDKPDHHKPEHPKPPDPDACGVDLYLSICYAECEAELIPAPFDECACNGITKRANRICEGYRIEWTTQKPDDWREEEDCEDDCNDLYKRLKRPCTKPGEPHCVPLFVIRNYEQGKPVTPDMIDYRYRRELTSTRLLDLVIRCMLRKLPTRRYTRVRDINWDHGMQYSCREFSRLFSGDLDSDASIQIRFTQPVRTETLSTSSFQAIVVNHGKEHTEGGYMEVAPARVWASTDRKTFNLRIDPRYVEHCLMRGSFDVFIVLRCNVLVDDEGYPVDGTLLARLNGNDVSVTPPSGDGLRGGTFESWFRVLD